jgi:hypothetical protein
MAARGDGIGIEVTATYLRAVLVSGGRHRHDCEAALPPHGSPEARLLEALIRLHETLDRSSDVPVRIACFPASSSLCATALGSDAASAHSSPSPRSARDDSALTVMAGSREWRLDLCWRGDAAALLSDLARRAGFRRVSVEPAPVSLGRVGPAGPYLAERTGGGAGWTALVDDGVPLLACAADDDRADSAADGLVLRSSDVGTASPVVPPLGNAPSHEEVQAALDVMLDEARVTTTGPIPVLADVALTAGHVVALGAAVGAARLAGRNRVAVTAVTTGDAVGGDLPWAVERLAAGSTAHRARPRSLLARLRAWWWSRPKWASARSGRRPGGEPPGEPTNHHGRPVSAAKQPKRNLAAAPRRPIRADS